jgi:hypothetical protein
MNKSLHKELIMDDNKDTIKKILSRIGTDVLFNFPGSEGILRGVIKERVVLPSKYEKTSIPYWDVVDLIDFSETREQPWMRFGYYRKANGKLQWGSQTTLTEPFTVWKQLFLEVARQKTWFKHLLEEVVREI